MGCFEPEQFVPLVNIAAGEWLARAIRYAPEELDALRRECEQREIPAIHRPDLPVVTPFHYDATVLYPSRWAALFKELSRARTNAEAARQWGEKHVRPLLKRMREAGQGEPPVYVACLTADGDRMGAAIDCLVSAEANREFSQELAKFPLDARGIVEQEHLGSLIYAGGDDVLAFLPVAKAPHCAAALAKLFRHRLQGKVTLSVGIGVGHVIEPMSVLLQLARGAERAAKDADRDALAIIVDKRSGGQRRLAMQWRSDPVGRLSKDARLLDEKLSTGKVYEPEALLRRFPDAEAAKARPEAAQALAAYANDIFSHTGEGKGASLKDLGVDASQDYAKLRDALAAAIDRILVVRSLREWGFA
jgi:CRISPR-associated protein Cmr2